MKKTILVLSLSFFFFVIAYGNSFADSASPSAAKATTAPKTPIDRDLHFSLSGYYVIPNTTPDVPAVKNSQAIAFQLSGAINFFQVGFEYFTVINSPHSYQYKVPYGEIEEHREYDIHSGHIFVRISPWHLAYMTPYFGGYFGGSWILDNSNNSSVFDDEISNDKFIVAGPVAGFELLPNSVISIFVEARKSYQIKSTIQRKKVNYVNQFGEKDIKIDSLKFDALYLGAGLRFNF